MATRSRTQQRRKQPLRRTELIPFKRKSQFMRVLLFLSLLASLPGCQYDPYAHLFTTDKPKASDVVGRYTLTEQTVTADGLDALQGKPCFVKLRADGTFTAANIPPFEVDWADKTLFGKLVSGSGTWTIDGAGSVDNGWGTLKTHWGVRLFSKDAEMHTAGLIGGTPPYGLIFTLGDPDTGTVMILKKD
jgi:hypothetical protein